MPSHFSSIGFPLDSAGDLERLLGRLVPDARPTKVAGGNYLEWTSTTGAQLLIQVDADNNLVGANPHFRRDARLRAAITSAVDRPTDPPLDGAFHAWADPTDDDPESGCYPFVFDCPDAAVYDALILPTAADIQLSAFAHSVELWESIEAYDAVESDAPRFASQSFIPSGLFSAGGETTEPPNAEAIFTGHIRSAEMLTNEITGAEFWWVLVSTLGGDFDVVIDPDLLSGSAPEIGGVLCGDFWLSGRFVGEPAQPRSRSWRSRLRGAKRG